MQLLKLAVVFAVLFILMVVFKKPLWMGAIAAIVTAVVVYWIPLPTTGALVVQALTSISTIEIIATMYLVNLLQVMMQQKGAIATAEKSMMRLFNNRRSIIVLAPIFMGMLPAPNAVLLSAPIVDATAGDCLNKGEKAFITSYYRHIPESALPIYPALLMGLGVTGLPAGAFLLYILPMALISIVVPFLTTVRKVPKETGLPESDSKWGDAKSLGLALWPIVLLIVAVMAAGFRASLTTLVICAALFFIYRFSFRQLGQILKSSFNPAIIGGMALILILKDIIAHTGVIGTLIGLFSALPIPLFLTAALVMFIGALTGLSNAIIAIMFPVLFATIPGAGIPLLVLMMSYSHAASQLSPTHICLEVAVNYFKSNFKDLILRTLSVTVVYCAVAVAYYLLLTAF